MKVHQQNYLQALRALARIYGIAVAEDKAEAGPGPGAGSLGPHLAQLFALLVATYQKALGERRELTCPDSVQVEQEVLFGNKEVKNVQARKQIKQMTKGMRPGHEPGLYSFRSQRKNGVSDPTLTGG